LSYQVIARKYRSQSFDELIGQDHVTQALLNALRNGRMPQALLFTGTRGVGKTSTARIFAKSIRCQNAKDFIPCNQCDDCLEINRGSHVDVMEIDGASNNGVDAIRELRESVSYMPSRGKYKIFIIDEVHMLSNSAFNALLKTLEEPPAHVIFMFATTEPQKIPATILSRCQRYDLKRVNTQAIADLLENICKKESIKCDDDALWAIAKHANGSVRDAQSALDLCISYSDSSLTETNVSEILGITDRHLRISILRALASRDKGHLLKAIEKISSAAIDPKVYIQNLLEDLRNLIIVKMDPNERHAILDLSESEFQDFIEVSSLLSEEEIHLLFDMALKGASDIQKAFEPRIVLEMVFMRMAAAPRIQFFYENHELKSPPPVANATKTEKKSPKSTEPVKTKAPPKQHDIQSLVNKWQDFVGNVANKNPLLATKLRHSAVKKTENQLVTLALDKDHGFMLEELNSKDSRREIQGLLAAEGYPVENLKFVLAKEEAIQSPERIEKTAKEKAEKEIRQKIENSDIFKKTQEVFKTSKYQLKELK